MRIRFIQPLLFGALLFSVACAGSSATPIPESDRGPDAVFFVLNHDREGLRIVADISQVIVYALKARGLQVSGGPPGARPKHVDFLVSYVDYWGIEAGIFLREITIDVTNARTGVKVAESRSHQRCSFYDRMSIGCSSWEEMVRRTAGQLVDGASAQEPN